MTNIHLTIAKVEIGKQLIVFDCDIVSFTVITMGRLEVAIMAMEI